MINDKTITFIVIELFSSESLYNLINKDWNSH